MWFGQKAEDGVDESIKESVNQLLDTFSQGNGTKDADWSKDGGLLGGRGTVRAHSGGSRSDSRAFNEIDSVPLNGAGRDGITIPSCSVPFFV